MKTKKNQKEQLIQSSINFENPQEGIYLLEEQGIAVNITEVTEGGLVTVRIARVAEGTTNIHTRITITELKEILGVIDEVVEDADDGSPIRHIKFDSIKAILELGDMPVYLYGPAGSGKNVICKQLADEMGLPFYYTNCVLTKYDLVGYGDANGKYVPTAFFKAFTEGGVFMLDEFDASDESAAITLNAALANRYFDFPVIGNVEAHPNFRIIACGNTCGRGADEEYTGRNCLDAATLDRFTVVKIDYDERVEKRIANTEIVDFIHDLRQSRDTANIKMILGYRVIERLAKLESKFSASSLVEMTVTKGMDKDEINILHEHLQNKQNKFAKALRTLATL
jgi:MoxR-like ATPase